MIEVYRNTSERVYMTINVGNIPTDADGDVTVTVTDLTTGTVLATTTAVNDTAEVGHYYYDVPLALTELDRKLEVKWQFELDAQPVVKRDIVSIVTSYVTPAEIIDALPELSTKPYKELKAMEKRVRLIINSYCGQSFGKWYGTETVRGTGGPELYLSTPTISIESVSGLTARWDADGWPIMPNSPIVAPLSDTWEIKFDGTWGGKIFYENRKYTVTGWFGWDYVPDEITEAAKLLIADIYCKDSIYRQKGINAVTSADWRLDYSPAAFAGTGNLDVDRLLAPFVVTRLLII
jgi:hypothetical protein